MSAFKSIRNIIRAVNIHPLAGRHRIKAYSKFLSWQLSQLLSPGLRKIPFAGGTFLLAKKGMTGATGNIYCGLHDFEDMSFLLHFLRAEDTFIDVGANIGSYTILASGVVRARSVSFEPTPSTFNSLRENVRINNAEQLADLFNAAAGAAGDTMYLTSDLDTVNHILAANEHAENITEVKVLPLDETIRTEKNVRLIKIDTEGFETEVLNGMPQLLSNPELKAIIIELNGSGGRYGYDENKIHEKLAGHGFEPYRYYPFERRPVKTNPFNNGNTIYLRDIDFIEARIKSAKKINIFSESY